MDIQMPGMDGVDTMNAIRSEFPGSRFIVLTTYQGDVQALRAIRAGAAGYLLKNMLRKDLLDTIRVVNSGRRVIPPVIAANLAEHLATMRSPIVRSMCCEALPREIQTSSSRNSSRFPRLLLKGT